MGCVQGSDLEHVMIGAEMDKQKAAKILEYYNLWRRDDNVPNKYEMPNPAELGVAIDIAIDAMKHEESVMRKDYYKSGNIEVFGIIEQFNLNFFLGNVVKYVCRCGKKPGASEIDDLEKAKTYIEYEIERRINEYRNGESNGGSERA